MILSCLKKQTFIFLLSLFFLESVFGTVTLPNMGVTRHAMLQRFGGKQALCQRTGLDQNTLLQRLIAGGVPDATIVTLGFTATEIAAARGGGAPAPVAAPAAPIVDLAAQNRQQGITQFATLAANIQQQINNSGQYNAYIDGTALQRNQIIQAAQAAILAEQQRQADLLAQQQAAQQAAQQAWDVLTPAQQARINRNTFFNDPNQRQALITQADNTIAAEQQRQADLLRQQQQAADLLAQQQAAQQAAQQQEQQRRQLVLQQLFPNQNQQYVMQEITRILHDTSANVNQDYDALIQPTYTHFDTTVNRLRRILQNEATLQEYATQAQAQLQRVQTAQTNFATAQQSNNVLNAQQAITAIDSAGAALTNIVQQATTILNNTIYGSTQTLKMRTSLSQIAGNTNRHEIGIDGQIRQISAAIHTQWNVWQQRQQTQQPQQPQPQQQQNGPRGLVNAGAYCFANAALQAIASVQTTLHRQDCQSHIQQEQQLWGITQQLHQAGNPVDANAFIDAAAQAMNLDNQFDDGAQFVQRLFQFFANEHCSCADNILNVAINQQQYPNQAQAVVEQSIYAKLSAILVKPVNEIIALVQTLQKKQQLVETRFAPVLGFQFAQNQAIRPQETITFNLTQNQHKTYNLKSILLYNGGHYKALVKRGQVWFECNDAQVTNGQNTFAQLQQSGKSGGFHPRMFVYETTAQLSTAQDRTNRAQWTFNELPQRIRTVDGLQQIFLQAHNDTERENLVRNAVMGTIQTDTGLNQAFIDHLTNNNLLNDFFNANDQRREDIVETFLEIQQANAQQPVQVQQPANQQIAQPTAQNPLVMYRQNNVLTLRTFSNANNNHYLEFNQCPVAHAHLQLGDEILLYQPCGHIVDTTRTLATTRQVYQSNGNCPVCRTRSASSLYRLPAQITGAVTYVRAIDVAPSAQQPVQQQVATPNRTLATATTTPTASTNNFATTYQKLNETINNLVDFGFITNAQSQTIIQWFNDHADLAQEKNTQLANNTLTPDTFYTQSIEDLLRSVESEAKAHATTTPVTTVSTPATQDLSQKLFAMISKLNTTDEELKANPINPQSLLKKIADSKLNPDIEKKVIDKLMDDDQLIKDIGDDASGDILQDLIDGIQRRQASAQSKTTAQLPQHVMTMINARNLEKNLKQNVIKAILAVAKYGLDDFDDNDLTDTIKQVQKAPQTNVPKQIKQIRTDSLNHYLEDIGLEQQYRQLLVSLENGDADSDNTIQQIETLLQKYYDNIDTSDDSARNTSYQLFKKFCIVANLCDTSLPAIEAKITGFTKAHQAMYEKKADIPQLIKDKIDPITTTITSFKTRIQAIRLDVFNKLREVYFYFYSGGAIKQQITIEHQPNEEEKLFTKQQYFALAQYTEQPFSISDLMTVNVKYHIADQAMMDNVDIGGIKRLLLTKLAKTCTHDKLKGTEGLQRVFTSLLWYTLANSYTPQNPILKIDWNGVSVDFSLPEKFWEDLLVNRPSEDCPQTICTEFWKTTEIQACRDSLGQGKTEDTIIKNVATTDVDNQTLSSYLNNGALQFLLMRKYIATLQPKQLMDIFSIITADELITIINKSNSWDSPVKQWLIQYIDENKNKPLILKAICTFATGSSKTDTLAINVFSGVEHEITCRNNQRNQLYDGIYYPCNCDNNPKQWKLPEGHTCNKYINFYNYDGMTYEIFKDKFEKAINGAQ